MGIIDSLKRGTAWIAKTVIDGVFDIIVDGGFTSFSSDTSSVNPTSPIMKKRDSIKVDAVRKVFKYESLVFHLWRSLWCTFMTLTAIFNVIRIGNVIENSKVTPDTFDHTMFARLSSTYTEPDKFAYHTYYDQKTASDLRLMFGFLLVDFLIYAIRQKFMTKSTLIHHALCLLFCLIALYSPYPHHYHANMFVCAEMVSCLTILSHFAKKRRSRLLNKAYLLQYLLLTVFGRGAIWYVVLSDLITIGASWVCYVGFAPFIIMDIIWSKQCLDGIKK